MFKYMQARLTEEEKIRAKQIALALRLEDREFVRIAILEKCKRFERSVEDDNNV